MKAFKIGIVAGEASGDLLGAKLIQSLRAQCPNVQIEGIGGPAMMASGCDSLFDIERLAVMGLVEPLFRLIDLIKLRHDLYRYFLKWKPDIFIGIDAPDFNLGLELKLHRVGIPVVHYVSPSVWAWRQYRVKKIAKAVDLMMTLLPFETHFYEKHNIPVKYVGHPLAEQIALHPDSFTARRDLCIDEEATYIALLPGSRRQEIRYMAEPFLRAAKIVWTSRPNVRFLTAHVNEKRYQEFYECYKRYAPDLPLQFFTRRSQDVMAASDVIVVTSGTATLEAMLFKKPMIIAYRMSHLAYRIVRWLGKAPFAGLPNLLAKKEIVPELIQEKVTPELIAQYIFDYLDHPEKVKELQQQFLTLHQSLQADSTNSIASAILTVVNKAKIKDSSTTGEEHAINQ